MSFHEVLLCPEFRKIFFYIFFVKVLKRSFSFCQSGIDFCVHVRQRSNVCFPHMNNRLSQHHLLVVSPFPPTPPPSPTLMMSKATSVTRQVFVNEQEYCWLLFYSTGKCVCLCATTVKGNTLTETSHPGQLLLSHFGRVQLCATP